MTQDTIQLNDSNTPLSEVLEILKQQYPAYYRAWKSMTTTYGVDAVATEWRGTAGLRQFIQDTSTLPNSPTQLPGVKVKLKRKVTGFKFDVENTYWKLPSHMKAADRKKATLLDMNDLNNLPTPTSSVDTSILSISDIKQRYPTIQEQEARMQELFDQAATDRLSSEESAELDLLGKLVESDGEIPIPPASRYEDI